MSTFILVNLLGKFLSILSSMLIVSFVVYGYLGKIKYQCRRNKENNTVVLCGAVE